MMYKVYLFLNSWILESLGSEASRDFVGDLPRPHKALVVRV